MSGINGDGELSPSELVLTIWHDIDYNGGRRVHEWFVPDGTITFDQFTVQGHDDISATYLERRDGTERFSRHVATNLVVEQTDDRTVRVTSLLILYAGNGEPPLSDLLPQVVADVFDEFVNVDGRWMAKSRRIIHVFIAPETVLGVPTS
jgi:hypothetical protein